MMATMHVDGRAYRVAASDNVLHACLSLGLDIPYFCWHPALGSVGACRQCAVKEFRDGEDRHGRLVMACMTPATDGIRISIADAEAVAFRSSVIEWLMTNHPHDCPVCPEGGECHLQDMTLMTGHVYRRYRFAKRTFRNQDLGPFIAHEMNRCIACYRCVRFYRDYAGGRDLDAFGAHNHVYFGRAEDGVLENPFSGNLVEVCPTGVFTDKTLDAVYTRKWDLKGAPSVCVHCGLGCNTIANARQGEVRRILNRYNGEVNGYFLCDRGRFGHGFLNSSRRIRRPLIARNGVATPVTGSAAIAHFATLLREQEAIGIGSPRASLEANFALRALVGPGRFHSGLAHGEERLLSTMLAILRDGHAAVASLREAEESDAVLVLGEDVSETAPRLALSLRQAVREAGMLNAERLRVPRWQDASVRDASRLLSPLAIATPAPTRLDEVASFVYRGAPDDIARLGFAVAHVLDATAPSVQGLAEPVQQLARDIATALAHARRPLVVSGAGAGSEAVIRAAANVADALCRTGRPARIALTVPECNSLGLTLMHGAPLSAALSALSEGRVRTVVVLENDLYRRVDAATVDAALGAAAHVVALDYLRNDTVQQAELVLAAGSFAEASGTLISNEGRAQRYFQLLFPEDDVIASWRWLNQVAVASGRSNAQWQSLDDVLAAMAAEMPELAAIGAAAPGAGFRVGGNRISSAPHRYSGRTALHADRTVFEPKPPANSDGPYTNSMEGYYGPMPAALFPYAWAPAWNSAQAWNKFQAEVGGAMAGGDAGVRLLGAPAGVRDFDHEVPPPFAPRRDQWLIVARHELFGSEELSALAPAVAERIGKPAIALNDKDAAGLGVAEGDLLEIALTPAAARAEVRIWPALPHGLAVLSVGIGGLVGIALPAFAGLQPAINGEVGR